MEVEVDKESEGEEGGGRTQRALEALEFLTQERSQAELSLLIPTIASKF